MQIEFYDHEDEYQRRAQRLYDLMDKNYVAQRSASSFAEIQEQMRQIRALENKLAALEWEIERSSYLIQEEPDLEDL